MTRREKLLLKLQHADKTFHWKDLVSLLTQCGYQISEGAGSRVRFFNPQTNHLIRIHRPHPGNEIHKAALKDIKTMLTQEGIL